MAYRIAINGYGRIGQCVLRALFEEQRAESAASLEIVAINELSDLDTIAYLTRYDTTHGRFPGEVEARDGRLIIDGHPIRVLSEPDPDRLPWRELGIDLVLECSGSFKDRATAERHLAAGAGPRGVSHPAPRRGGGPLGTRLKHASSRRPPAPPTAWCRCSRCSTRPWASSTASPPPSTRP